MIYGDFKNLTRSTTCDKILRDKAFNIAINPFLNGKTTILTVGLIKKISLCKMKYFPDQQKQNKIWIRFV